MRNTHHSSENVAGVRQIWNKIMPIVLFFSSRQISAHLIRNFRSNQSTPGRFDNIESTHHPLLAEQVTSPQTQIVFEISC